MKLRQILDDGEPETESATQTIDCGPLLEKIEDVRHLLGRNTYSIVFNHDDDLFRLVTALQGDVAAGLSIFGGIGKEIRDYLREAERIGLDHHSVARERHRKMMLALFD